MSASVGQTSVCSSALTSVLLPRLNSPTTATPSTCSPSRLRACSRWLPRSGRSWRSASCLPSSRARATRARSVGGCAASARAGAASVPRAGCGRPEPGAGPVRGRAGVRVGRGRVRRSRGGAGSGHGGARGRGGALGGGARTGACSTAVGAGSGAASGRAGRPGTAVRVGGRGGRCPRGCGAVRAARAVHRRRRRCDRAAAPARPGGARRGLVEPVLGGRLGRGGRAARPSEVLPAFHAELRVRRVVLPAARACGHGGTTLTVAILTDLRTWRRCRTFSRLRGGR